MQLTIQNSKNAFPGYEYIPPTNGNKPKNMYRGVDLGFGGYVYSEPGIYTNVALLDLQSMHPNSAINLNYFGEYTQRYKELLDARLAIKNGEFDKAEKMFDGKLKKYLENKTLADQLATALKLAANSVYGLSSASFPNPFRDSRNKNNIIALRGALFMKTLQDDIVKKGYRVCAIRTDSIKVPNADNEIIKFCMKYAEDYGYSFQHEATYERMCLVDKANYIATYLKPEKCEKMYGYIPKDNAKHFAKHDHPWTSTGDTFQQPYIFKTLFSGEPVTFDDMCVTNSVKNGAIYLDYNELLPDVSLYEKELKRRIHNAENPENKMRLNDNMAHLSESDLEKLIEDGHNYQFIGRVGRFFPVKPMTGGGVQLVKRNDKYASVSGSKGYRWIEAEAALGLNKTGDADPIYFNDIVTDAISKIDKFGSFERFIDLSKPYVDISEDGSDDDPPWNELPPVVPCGDGKYNTCLECPNCKGDLCKRGYSLASYIEGGD